MLFVDRERSDYSPYLLTAIQQFLVLHDIDKYESTEKEDRTVHRSPIGVRPLYFEMQMTHPHGVKSHYNREQRAPC